MDTKNKYNLNTEILRQEERHKYKKETKPKDRKNKKTKDKKEMADKEINSLEIGSRRRRKLSLELKQ